MNDILRISNLIEDLAVRSSRAALSQLGLRSQGLREHLSALYALPPGERGSLLSDPVVEANFGWAEADIEMKDLPSTGLLHEELVNSLDDPPAEFGEECRFPRDRKPFAHQLQCWQHLLDEVHKSVLVTSGTGSGKTECFLIPILEDLVRTSSITGPAAGVRAIFIYPLNALINSQRERLGAWCNGLSTKLQFCLYNGETPEFAPSEKQRRAGAEQISRKALRESPAQILVTNSTMLEYMLVRTEDQPILEHSRGKLRWIVLDEAHTYIGSQAAEMALLLRRVLHRFATEPSQVRFVATSATIGSKGDTEDLRRFLSDVSGSPLSRIHVITGTRSVPELPTRKAESSEQTFNGLSPERLYHALCQYPHARKIRRALRDQPVPLTRLRQTVGLSQQQLTRILEYGSVAKNKEQIFLPIRLHLFQRTQAGLWACSNSECPGQQKPSVDEWAAGAIHIDRKTNCTHCGYPVYEVVSCGDCGQEYLSAQERYCSSSNQLKLEPFGEVEALDEFQLEVDLEDDDSSETEQHESVSVRRLICCSHSSGGQIEHWFLDQDQTLRKDGAGVQITLTALESGATRCMRCGSQDHSRKLFRELRIGAPFALSTIIPIALEHTSPIKSEPNLPSQGRRILGFSDSRQGSARLAVRLQQESERNQVRAVLYHALAAERTGAGESARFAELKSQVSALEQLTSEDLQNPAISQLLSSRRAELAQVSEASRVGSLSWREAADRLKDTSSFSRMRKRFRETSYIDCSTDQFAEFCLYREFFRRPKRMNSAETLGIVAMRYPELQARPAPRDWVLSEAEWGNFLKIMVDFVIRDASAVNMDDAYLSWMGIPVRKRFMQGPGFEGRPSRRQRLWPAVRPGGRPPRIARLLRMATGLDESPSSGDRINYAFMCAWKELRPYLQSVEDGYLLNLNEIVEFSEISSGWVCPYTHRVLDTTLNGLSPYLGVVGEPEKCRTFVSPQIPEAYWRDESGKVADREKIKHWLESDKDIQEARRLGIWSNLNDRIASNADYFEAIEHSAQLDGSRLRQIERRFKEGQLNVLSCSTTMEMGVDIGGLSAVVMNNTPPSPVNYLQRAGRAGRRKDGVSFSITLCRNNPHGNQVFNNPLWPFNSRISAPKVGFDSERLVQRHVNALCLGRFLESSDVRRLKTGWFFEEDSSGATPGRQFIEWCRATAEDDEEVSKGVQNLVYGTALASSSVERLLLRSASTLDQIVNTWQTEVKALYEEAAEFGGIESDSPSPAILAIRRQVRRLKDEYLLRELTNQQFLPGYGFPTGVVSFVPTTIEDLKKRERESESREESLGRRLGYPSRQIESAIREYAPGAEVTIDGRVYRSGGVTLNWHIPPNDETAHEVQALRLVWRCRHCGVTGDSVVDPQSCPQCGQGLDKQKYLQPAGFTTDVRHSPHNNVVTPKYIRVEPPWISCPSPDWSPLADSEVGRFRYSDSGHLFYGNRGASGHGYALCLRCGRAASEFGPASHTGVPDEVGPGHLRLRGGKEEDGSSLCTGSDYSVQRGLSLGASRTTDVFELQLSHLRESETALSIGIALRRAFCHGLGIQEEEVGVAVRQSKWLDGSITQSIFLFDSATGGNGYVAVLRDEVSSALKASVPILDCPKQCDSACHACLLTFDTQHDATNLDRLKALEFLSRACVPNLDLSERSQLLGSKTRLLTRPLHRHLAETAGAPTVNEVRVWFDGGSEEWEVESLPIYPCLLQWINENRQVTLIVSTESWERLDEANRLSLASLVTAGRGNLEVHLSPTSHTRLGEGFIAAAAGGEEVCHVWAVTGDVGRTMNAEWCQTSASGVCVYATFDKPLGISESEPLSLDQIRPQPSNRVAIVEIRKELNGAIEQFGESFWNLMLDRSPRLRQQFSGNESIQRVIYSDRYVTSPWALLLLREIFQDLVRKGQVDSRTLLHLFTQELHLVRGPRRSGDSVSDQFRSDAMRKDFFELAMKSECGEFSWNGPVELHTGGAPHYRELRLEWDDSVVSTFKLDQGVGYWRCRPSFRFPFENSADQQLVSSQQLGRSIQVVSQSNHPTFVYVESVVGS